MREVGRRPVADEVGELLALECPSGRDLADHEGLQGRRRGGRAGDLDAPLQLGDVIGMAQETHVHDRPVVRIVEWPMRSISSRRLAPSSAAN